MTCGARAPPSGWNRSSVCGPATDRSPVWTSDSKRIAFASDRAQPGVLNLYMMHADGGGTTTRLTKSPNQQGLGSWHKSSRYLAFVEARGTATQQDVRDGSTAGDEVVFMSNFFEYLKKIAPATR